MSSFRALCSLRSAKKQKHDFLFFRSMGDTTIYHFGASKDITLWFRVKIFQAYGGFLKERAVENRSSILFRFAQPNRKHSYYK